MKRTASREMGPIHWGRIGVGGRPGFVGVRHLLPVVLVGALSLGGLAACGGGSDEPQASAPAAASVSAQDPETVAAAERAVYGRVGNLLAGVRADYPDAGFVQTDGPAVCRPFSDSQLDCTQKMRDRDGDWTGTGQWRVTVDPETGKPAVEEHGGTPLAEQLGVPVGETDGGAGLAEGPRPEKELEAVLRAAGLTYAVGRETPSDVEVVPVETAQTGRTGQVNVELHRDASAAKQAQRDYVGALARPEGGRGVAVGSFFVWLSSTETDGISAAERRDVEDVARLLRRRGGE